MKLSALASLSAIAASLFIVPVGTAMAQARTIRIVVPYGPGGPIDVTARILAERVKDSLGTVIIENKPGGGGNIGVDVVAKAAPDGNTIGIAAVATHAINPWLYSKMPFNAATDFAPVTQMVRVPNVLVLNADTASRLGINSVADLIQYAKAHPGKLNYGSGGNGSGGHLAGEMFKSQAAIFTAPVSASAKEMKPVDGAPLSASWYSCCSAVSICSLASIGSPSSPPSWAMRPISPPMRIRSRRSARS